MGKFVLSRRSLGALDGVHPALVAIVHRAIEITEVDFMVYEGRRSVERQVQLYKQGVSRTLDSNHLEQDDGWAHAVDLVPWIPTRPGRGRLAWDASMYRWRAIAAAMDEAAEDTGHSESGLEWGGSWTWFDGAHYQLNNPPAPLALEDRCPRSIST